MSILFIPLWPVQKYIIRSWSSHCGAVETNLTSIHIDVGLIPGPHSVGRGSGIAMSCGVDHAVAAQILQCCGCGCGVGWQLQLGFNLQVWELPCATGVALKSQKKEIYYQALFLKQSTCIIARH